MSTDSGFSLGEGIDLAGISFDELYYRYICLGGNGSTDRVRQHLNDDNYATDHEHNIIAQALNEVFLDLGDYHPVRYRRLDPPEVTDTD